MKKGSSRIILILCAIPFAMIYGVFWAAGQTDPGNRPLWSVMKETWNDEIKEKPDREAGLKHKTTINRND